MYTTASPVRQVNTMYTTASPVRQVNIMYTTADCISSNTGK